MTQNIQKIFKKLKDIEPSACLESNITQKIAQNQDWQAKKKLIFADTLTIFSLGAFVFVLLNFWSGIAKSEFWSLAKLAFTDAGIVASHWTDFGFSLLETFPAAHLAVVLAPVFLLMVSLKIYFSTNNYNQYNNYIN